MGKFNRYARELDGAVKAYFEKYKAAESKVKEANEKIEEVNADIREFMRTGNKSAEYTARARLASLQVERNRASDEFTEVKKANKDVHGQIREIRSRLETECNAAFALDPDAIDPGFFQLLNSGLVKPADYESLWKKAEKAGNVTMMRLIADAAGVESEAQHDKGNYKASAQLSNIASLRDDYTTSGVVRKFDELGYIAKLAIGDPQAPSYTRAVPNEMFFERWDEVAGAAIESF